MNIMILSPGRRVEIVEYFKKAVEPTGGKIITVDMSPYAPALYHGDKSYCIPKNFEDLTEYIRRVIEIGKEEAVTAVLSLIDPELPLLAENKELFLQNGITPIISEKEMAEVTFDKYAFFEKFKEELPVIPTWASKEDVLAAIDRREVKYPIFGKVRTGSGSEGLKTFYDGDELKAFESKEDYIFQPFCKKKEFGVDIYFDLIDGQIKRYFVKEKLSMRSGETDKAVSIRNKQIEEIIMKLSGTGFLGPVDMDVFEDFDGRLLVNEMNPRFGGGYPHAYNAGVNFMDAIVQNLQGKVLKPELGQYREGLIMMKYNGLAFMDEHELLKRE